MKYLSDELSKLSKGLRDETPHLFCIFDGEKEQFAYWGNIGDVEAAQIIELLAKQHGGEVLDGVIDKLIEDGEDLDFPEIIHPAE